MTAQLTEEVPIVTRREPPVCPQCEREHGWYGVEMSPVETTEPWRNGFRCPHGHTMAREGYDWPAGDLEPTPYDDWREVWSEDTSRAGRWVPPDVTGGDATGASKERVNPYRWIRRGA